MQCTTIAGVSGSLRPACVCFRGSRKNITGAPPAGLWSHSQTRPGKALRAHLLDAAALHHAVESSQHALTHLSRSFLTVSDIEAATQAAVATVGDAAADSAAAATANAAGGGPFGFLADIFESLLQALDGGLEKLGVPYSYGFAIITLTVMVKLATFPLTQKQVESTLSLQALQPRVKEIQAKYADTPEEMNVEIARLYKSAGVNPLAGCLPTLATIPVFIGLYRALTQAADQGLLTDGFFFIPSLGGPTSIMDRQAGAGLAWLFPLQDGAPPVGWHDAIAYLVLPTLLVASQYVSQKVISSASNQDPSQQSAQAILKFLPLMIGWFSLNVPSGLSLYWLVNNILSTGQQVYLKSRPAPALAGITDGPGESTTTTVVNAPIVDEPKRVSGRELGSRKKKRSADIEVEAEVIEPSSRSSKGEKFRALKAREAATRAASVATSSSDSTARGSRFAAQKEKEAKGVATAEAEPELKVPDAAPAKDSSTV